MHVAPAQVGIHPIMHAVPRPSPTLLGLALATCCLPNAPNVRASSSRSASLRIAHSPTCPHASCSVPRTAIPLHLRSAHVTSSLARASTCRIQPAHLLTCAMPCLDHEPRFNHARSLPKRCPILLMPCQPPALAQPCTWLGSCHAQPHPHSALRMLAHVRCQGGDISPWAEEANTLIDSPSK